MHTINLWIFFLYRSWISSW